MCFEPLSWGALWRCTTAVPGLVQWSVLEEPQSADLGVSELANDTIKVLLGDLPDVVLHGLDLESLTAPCSYSQTNAP